MNLAELQKKLLRVARKNAPDDGVPYGFEKRVMARLAAAQRQDTWNWNSWVRPLWYAAAVCSLVALLTGTWSMLGTPLNDSDGELSFSQDLEQTILDSTDEGDIAW
jgi:hypothetical protein